MNKKAKGKKKPAANATKNKGPKKQSRRSVQRLIALRMGLENGTIKAEELREACRKAGVYNAPNFKQDMKKEAALFTAIQKDGKTTGWKLTAVGRELAKQAPPPPTKTTSAKKAPEKPKKAAAAKKTEKPAAKKASAPKATAKKATGKRNPAHQAVLDKIDRTIERLDGKKSSGKGKNKAAASKAAPSESTPTPPPAENVTESTPTTASV